MNSFYNRPSWKYKLNFELPLQCSLETGGTGRTLFVRIQEHESVVTTIRKKLSRNITHKKAPGNSFVEHIAKHYWFRGQIEWLKGSTTQKTSFCLKLSAMITETGINCARSSKNHFWKRIPVVMQFRVWYFAKATQGKWTNNTRVKGSS